MGSGYRLFGQALRLPLFLLGALLWSLYVFPFIVFFAFLGIIGQPLIVPVVYFVAFVCDAFSDKKEAPSFAAYWKDYPNRYVRWLRIGYRGLYVWFLSGWK